MVLSNLIVSLMNKFLSPFVEDFNPDQLSVFGWSGQFKLCNVNIKPNAFDSMRLPFRVIHGYIGQIEAQVPWMNIYTEPIVIRINDINAVIVPQTEVAYDENVELDYEWQLKKSYLDNIEMIKQKLEQESDGAKKEDDGFVMKLVASAIKNIQIFINNVHFCYEDSSSSQNLFQIGLAFSKLVFETEPETTKSKNTSSLINKIIKLESFSIYLNSEKVQRHHGKDRKSLLDYFKNFFRSKDTSEYILCPMQFHTLAQIDRKPEASDYKNPALDLKMLLESFRISLNDSQVKSILLLLDALDRLKTQALYRKWRPKVSIKENPKLWWKFLYTALVETGIRRRKREFSWENIEAACKRRRKYTELYKRKLLGQNIDSELEQLEKSLNLVVIVMARAEAEIATKKILKEMQKEKNSGWFGGWWSSNKNSQNDDLENLKKEFTDGDEKKKLYKAIDYDENAMTILYPPNFVAYKVNFHVLQLGVTLKKGDMKITAVDLKNFVFKLRNRPGSSNSEIEADFDAVKVTGTKNASLMNSTVDKKFLHFLFEVNPLDKLSDLSILLEMNSLHFFYDIDTLVHLQQVLMPPEDVSLEEIKSAAQYKLDDLKLVTYSQVQNAIEKHKQLKLSIKIQPSYVIVPKQADLNKASILLLVSLGEFTMTSNLVSKSNANRVTDSMDLEEIKSMVYETYTMQVKNVQVLLSDRTNWRTDIGQLDTERHLLCPFELMIKFQRSILGSHNRFPKINLDGQIPLIQIKASDAQVSKLLNLLTTLPFGPDKQQEKEFDLIDIPKRKPSSIHVKAAKSAIFVTDEVIDAMNYAARAVSEINKIKQSELKSETDGSNTVIVCKDVVFGFKLKEILVSLFRSDRQENSRFSRFKLEQLGVDGEILSDSTLWVNLSISDLLLDDIRSNRSKEGIFTMLSKSYKNKNNPDDKSILSVYMAKKVAEMMVVVTISGMRLILAVDYILVLVDFAVKATSSDDGIDLKASADNKSKISTISSPNPSLSVKSSEKGKTKMMIECSLSKMEIIMLECIENSNCDAAVLKFGNKINLQIADDVIILCGYISRIQMALTNYIDYNRTDQLECYIMAPFDLAINGSIKGSTQMLDFTFDNIYINISPGMVQIMLKILSGIGGPPNENIRAASERFDTRYLLEPKKIPSKLWFLNCATQAKDALYLLQQQGDVIEQKSNLIINMSKIQVLIKSGGLDAHPLIRVELSTFAKLIDNKNLNFECSLLMDYYNHSLSSWEPFIEPVDNKVFTFRGNLSLEEVKHIELVTTENLEILLTRSALNVLLNVSEAFSQIIQKEKSHTAELDRLIINNYLGFNIKLLLPTSNIVPVEETSDSQMTIKTIILPNDIIVSTGKEYHFRSKDPNNILLHVNILFNKNVVVERTIVCQKKSIRCYNTSIKTYPVDEGWKFIVQVNDRGSVKEIIFRSNVQISNNFDNSFELYSGLNDDVNYLTTINAHSMYYLPIPLVYSETTLFVKPSNDFELCVPPFLWRDVLKEPHKERSLMPCGRNNEPQPVYKIVACINKNQEKKRFRIKIRSEKTPVHFEDTEKNNPEAYINTIRMLPLAKLRNLLPYNVEFIYSPLNETKVLSAGEEFNLPYIDFGNSAIKYLLTDYLGHDWIARERIPASGESVSTTICKFEAVEDKNICISLPIEFKIENSIVVMSIFSEFWVMNRTNEKIRLRLDDSHIYSFKENHNKPQLLCCNHNKSSKKLSLAIADSEFSATFPSDVAPYKVTLAPKAHNQKYSYLISLRIETSRLEQTKILAIEPFYSVINLAKQKVLYSENNEDWFSVDKNSLMPFYPKKSANQSVCFRLEDSEYDSKHISLRESSQTLLPVERKFLFVEVDVTELESKIRINEYFEGAAPVLLVNTLNHPIYYGQQDVSDWKTGKHIRILDPSYMAYFCWIDPYKTRQLVYKTSLENPNEISVNVDFDTFLKYPEGYAWVSFLDGKQRVLLFTTDLTLPQNLLMTNEFIKPDLTFELSVKGFGFNLVDDSKHLDLLYLSIRSKTIWESHTEENKTFKPVSIKENDILEQMYQHYLLTQSNSRAAVIKSERTNYEVNFSTMNLLNPRLAHLRRVANRGFWLLLRSSEHVKNVHIRINEIQIDNQLTDHVYDVVFAPVVVPKSVSDKYGLEHKHFIEICAIVCPGSINRFKHIQVLIQEFMLQIDLGWVLKIADVFNVKPEAAKNSKELIVKELEYLRKYNSAEELQKYVMNKSYYDFIMLGPIKIHLSMNLSEAAEGRNDFFVGLIIRLTGSVSEISDALFKLDYFERKLVFLGQEELIKQMIDHYKNQVLMQIYKVVLGLDIIGNPMKLALGIKKGIGDFFYEPAIGIIHGPEEFAEGLATGVKSLASGVLGGTAEALGRIGNRLGTSVAALTLDEKLQKDRRERLNQKRNFAESGKNLFRGILSGITGVVTKPIEGAKEEGVEGLFKGVGKGVVGVFAQPATSVIDFASDQLIAFNNAIDPKKVAQPIRIPRPFTKAIKPYSHHEAKGHQLLNSVRGSKFPDDNYVEHIQISNNATVLLTDCHLLYVKLAYISNQWEVDWYLDWSNIKETFVSTNKIYLKLKATKKGFLLDNVKERVITFNNYSTHTQQQIQALYQKICSMANSRSSSSKLNLTASSSRQTNAN